MIKTKSVYEPNSGEDGLRVLVTRYWPRGVKKGSVDEWVKGLGTPPELIKGWKAGTIEWEDLSRGYMDYLATEAGRTALQDLDALVKSRAGKTVTLLCTCKAGDKCHRYILKNVLEGQGA